MVNSNMEKGFLRSINIGLDAEDALRIAHFRPTSKSVSLLDALLGNNKESSYFVVAPYGSGKSIASTYALHLIENRENSREVIRIVNQHMQSVAPKLAKFSELRLRNKKQGCVIVLQGHCPSLCASLREGILNAMGRLKLGREATSIKAIDIESPNATLQMLAIVREKLDAAGVDRMAIVWDEFGRHLETLIAEGKSSSLSEVQDLAEFASRRTKINVTLALLLHRELLQYAGSVPQSVRLEWTKIEGRFKAIHYVDDSKEVYQLLADVIQNSVRALPPKGLSILRVAKKLHNHGLFQDFKEGELADLVNSAYPLNPVSLYLLPRVSSRIAQNERTLFSFLHETEFDTIIGPDKIYDYFSPQMRSDSGAGGTHRQWLETESALQKVRGGELEEAILKTVCLLGLGLSGERARAQRALVPLAVDPYNSISEVENSTESLIGDGLLLFRKHANELSVWHGTDVDLRGRVETEKAQISEAFDLLNFLRKECLLPVWRPVQYNVQFGLRRYFRCAYHSTISLQAWLAELPHDNLAGTPTDADGLICYIIPESDDDCLLSHEIAKTIALKPWLVIVAPQQVVPVADAAHELHALNNLQRDENLLGSDPLVLPELQHMADDARKHLQRSVDAITKPTSRGSTWYIDGIGVTPSSPQKVRSILSESMRALYPETPKFRNEMIVRRKPSAAIVNSRKKLVMGILERTRTPNLGLEGNYPDSAMFRTLLLGTSLYKEQNDGRWGFATPEELSDPKLKNVWALIREFYTSHNEEGKSVNDFLLVLKRSPIGLREGVLPILMAAGLRAFPSAVSLLRDGVYVKDILPSDIETLCNEPKRHLLVVMKLTKQRRSLLEGIIDLFSATAPIGIPEQDLVRRAYDAIESWKYQLPKSSLRSRTVADQGRLLRNLIGVDYEPTHLFFEELPSAAGSQKAVLDFLRNGKATLEEVAQKYLDQASAAIERSIRMNLSAEDSLRSMAHNWVKCFDREVLSQMPDPKTKALVFRLNSNYDSDEKLVESVSSAITGLSLSEWDDRTINRFTDEFRRIVSFIEEHALTSSRGVIQTSDMKKGLSALGRGRISEIARGLVDTIGKEQTVTLLKEIEQELNSGVNYGQS